MKNFLAICAVLAPAGALAQETKTFSGIEEVEVADFIGTVIVKTGGDAVVVRKTDGADAGYVFDMREVDGRVVMGSDEDPDETRWYDDVNWRRYEGRAFEVFLEDYPTVEVTVPRGTALRFDSAVIRLDADDTDGALTVSHGHVDGQIGRLASGDIGIHGSGDLLVGDVAGALDVNIHGSGDFRSGDAAELDASIHGSGDIVAGDIASAVEISLHGSGDVSLADIGAGISISIHGSGDVEAAKVAGGAKVSTMGSGDVDLRSVNGETRVTINGSGDVYVAGGRAADLYARIHGAGDFEMAGLASNPDVAVHGSGSIRVARHEGPVRARGRGDIRISGVDYGEDD